MNILLVEDNIADIFIMQEAIDELNTGHHLETASNGEAALKKIRAISQKGNNNLFDLIFLDINIPRPDGRQILKILKEDPKYCTIPVVFLTTSNDLKDIKYAYENHVNAFVTKPSEIDDFFKYIKNIVRYWEKMA
jgi:CheY-like chemotaxis protein